MEVLSLLFFLVILISLLLGYPVSFTLGGVSVIVGLIVFGADYFTLLPLRIWGIMSNYILLAVPLFIFMGVMMEKSGIAEALLEFETLEGVHVAEIVEHGEIKTPVLTTNKAVEEDPEPDAETSSSKAEDKKDDLGPGPEPAGAPA